MVLRSDTKKFTIETVGETPVVKQLTEMKDGEHYIIREVDLVFSGTPKIDAFFHLNSAAVDAAATRFGERYYQTLSAIIIRGDQNGIFPGALTTKPYIHISAGTGADSQTVYGTIDYDVWSS